MRYVSNFVPRVRSALLVARLFAGMARTIRFPLLGVAAFALSGIAMAAAPPASLAALAPHPSEPPLPNGTYLPGPTIADWLHVTQRNGDVNIRQFVSDLLREAAEPTQEEEASFELWLASSGALRDLKLTQVKEGPNKGLWFFLYRRGLKMPSDAVRLQIGETAPYHVSAETYCAKRSCKDIDAALTVLRSPGPPESAPAEVHASWRELVATEACVTGPVHQPPPSYPHDLQDRGIEGTTTVVMLYNRCGEVRAQRVAKSSGSKRLDFEALAAVSTWRVPVFRPGVSESAKADISFRLDE
jgi:TonB family protein